MLESIIFHIQIPVILLSQSMKNFRSSKNLKVIDTNNKQESQLRLKIKMLQQQVQTLQKSNLNIFIPLSEHEAKPTTNYEAIINKLKTQILNLQQEIQRAKVGIKKLENEKEMQKINFQNEIEKLQEEITQLKEQNQQMSQENESLHQRLSNQQQKRKQKEKQAIELRVQNKFIKQDLSSQKRRRESIEKKYEQIHSCVLAVNFNSRIYKSKEIAIIAMESEQLKSIKAYTEELERRIRQMMNANRQERISLGVKKENLGEQIVRLKQNIDLQLGLQLNSQATKSFLTAYNQTNNKFNQLITSCKIKE